MQIHFLFIGLLLFSFIFWFIKSGKVIRSLGVFLSLITFLISLKISIPFIFGPSQSIIFLLNNFYIDPFSALFIVLITFTWLSAMIVSYNYIYNEEKRGVFDIKQIQLYYFLSTLFALAMMIFVSSNNIGILWFSLELTTLITMPLVAIYKQKSSVEAAWKYILICTFGLMLSLLGILILAYSALSSGSNSSDAFLLTSLKENAHSFSPDIVRLAFIFIFIGFSTKVGLVPMHTWLPDAHSRTPSPISAMLSGILINLALYAIIRFRLITDLALNNSDWTSNFFIVFGFISVVIAAFILLVQHNYKRMLAYHSIEHMGLITFALGFGQIGAIGALIHMIGHMLAKTTLFFGAGEILTCYQTTKISKITNLIYRLPYTAVLFLLAFLALVAVPTSMIFTSELTFLVAAAKTHLVITIFVFIALTMVFCGVMEHILSMFFNKDDKLTQINSSEKFNITHFVMLIEIILIYIGGAYFLTPNGYDLINSLVKIFSF